MLKFILHPIIILLLFLSTFAYVANKVQDPVFIVNQARQNDFYGRLTGQIEPLLPKDTLKNSPLTSSDIKDITVAAVDAPTFYDFGQKYLTAYMDWLNGKTDQLEFSYNTEPVRERAIAATDDKMLAKYNNLPVCQTKDLKTWNINSGLPSCRLPEGNVKSDSVEQSIHAQDTQALGFIPDTFVPNQTQNIGQARQVLILTNKVIKGVWLLTAIFIALYLLLYRLKGLLSLGVIFLVVGGLQVAFSLIAWDWLGRFISDMIGGANTQTIAPLIISVITSAMNVLKTIMGNLSIATLITGGVMIVIGIIARLHKAVPIPH